MADHHNRFAHWQKKLSKNTSFLVDQVLTRIVPMFERRGFVWYADYAGGDSKQVGANTIPLQYRCDGDWPTVHISFDKRLRPFFGVDFASLPPICYRRTESGCIKIEREKATIVDAPAFFCLCKGQKRSLDCEYGYRWAVLFPRRYLDTEIKTLLSLLPELFDVFDGGIPDEWLRTRRAAKVTRHVMVLGSRIRSEV